jgi:hypothetical protein
MKRDPHPEADSGVDAAIARVLAAESAARASIADVERDCAMRIERARAAARAIDERAEGRIRVARERFEANVAREVDALRLQADSLGGAHALDEADARAIDAAVAKLAAILTGGRR